ncbi:MAG TPA: ABC transporter permease [Candidatus Dormibacteraeota bacterium]|nr:ABC transporter permease [Candidatus Dormibacteraeota bacterium]
MSWLRVAWSAARLELGLMAQERLFVGLTVLAAVSFVAMVSLFGLTGSRAPMALIDRDHGRYAGLFVEALDEAHHSFRLIPMGQARAEALIGQGHLVGSITIPAGFSRRIAAGQTVVVQVQVDNVDVDLTNDVQRAMPAAIVIFGRKAGFPGVRAEVEERDLIPHDTDYVPYLAVSALALAAFVIAVSLSALAVAREWEAGTVRLWRVSPASPTALLAGKLLATGLVASGALAAAVLAVVFGYGVHPRAPLALAVVIVAGVVIFSCMGAWLGTVLRRTLPVVPLTFGLVLPLYMDSGALEPTRFDGDPIWVVAHLTPLYYAVGVLEWAFHGLQVTPEPIPVDLLVLVAFAAAAVVAVRGALRGQGA